MHRISRGPLPSLLSLLPLLLLSHAHSQVLVHHSRWRRGPTSQHPRGRGRVLKALEMQPHSHRDESAGGDTDSDFEPFTFIPPPVPSSLTQSHSAGQSGTGTQAEPAVHMSELGIRNLASQPHQLSALHHSQLTGAHASLALHRRHKTKQPQQHPHQDAEEQQGPKQNPAGDWGADVAAAPAGQRAPAPGALSPTALDVTADSPAAAEGGAVGGQVSGVTPVPTGPPPRLDLSGGAMVCSDGAGERCAREADASWRVSSFTNSHGVMHSPHEYFYGHFSVEIKLQAGYTGGINTAFYLIDTTTPSNKDKGHAEIDLEFYGARNATRILMATNVFAGGKQSLTQFHIPFDGAAEFHEYSISWSDTSIVWFVDGTPFRVLNRKPNHPWPSRSMQPMISVWDTSSWTKLQAHYSLGPMNSWFRNFKAVGCVAAATSPKAGCAANRSPQLVWNKPLSRVQLANLLKLKKKIFVNDWGWDNAK